MVWELEIHIIDVGQGDSSLIIAHNTASGQYRTMLIDAGEGKYARTVHDYVVAHLPAGAGLDHILVSHYHKDHVNGVTNLLIMDNIYRICEIIANAAGNAAYDAATNAPSPGDDQYHQVAAAAAAATAAMLGGYDDGRGNDCSGVAVAAGQAAWVLLFAADITLAKAAREGMTTGKVYDGGEARNASFDFATKRLHNVAQEVGNVAGTTAGNAAARSAAALDAAFRCLKGLAGYADNVQVRTNGIYHNVNLIDIGDTENTAEFLNYKRAISSEVVQTGTGFPTPCPVNRTRTILAQGNLDDEVLWGTGADAGNPPANAPAMLVVACQRYIWHAPPASVPINPGGQPENSDSIGVILRFNNFFYYTGGDLPIEGEDLIATAVMGNGLPNPAGGNFARPDRIACFKCGHHGSAHSTSQNFLNRIQPKAAFISCGWGVFGPEVHPAQATINRLHGRANLQFFYLTNCLFETTYIPATLPSPPLNPGDNQLTVPGNKSRVAGDNDDDNLSAGRHARGNIRIFLTQAESQAAAGPGRQFHVEYWDEYRPQPPGGGGPNPNPGLVPVVIPF